jgi:hypothetical protein
MKITKNNRIVDMRIEHAYNDGMIAIQYQDYYYDGTLRGHGYDLFTPTKYAHAYHSEMTDITVLFIANSEDILDDNIKLFGKYFETDGDSHEFNKLRAHFNKLGIEIQDDETCELEDNIIITDYSSYRF